MFIVFNKISFIDVFSEVFSIAKMFLTIIFKPKTHLTMFPKWTLMSVGGKGRGGESTIKIFSYEKPNQSFVTCFKLYTMTRTLN